MKNTEITRIFKRFYDCQAIKKYEDHHKGRDKWNSANIFIKFVEPRNSRVYLIYFKVHNVRGNY